MFMCLTAKAYTITMLCLMPDKSRDSYDRMFGMLHDYCEENELDTQWINSVFMTDFEVAMRSSILLFFPSVQLLACFFHFCQRMVFYMKAAGLQSLNERDATFHSFMRRLSSLPLVPKHRVREALSLLEERSKKQKNEAQKFCAEILDLIRRVYLEGQYCMDDWNIHDVDLVLTPVTNNGNEGTNRGIAEDFGQHPQANKWLVICCDVLSTAEDKIQQLLFGSLKPRKNEQFDKLKQEREILKGNLSSGELTLYEYMGQIGSLAFTISRTRHNQNYSEIDFEKEVIETGTDLGITVNIGKKT